MKGEGANILFRHFFSITNQYRRWAVTHEEVLLHFGRNTYFLPIPEPFLDFSAFSIEHTPHRRGRWIQAPFRPIPLARLLER